MEVYCFQSGVYYAVSLLLSSVAARFCAVRFLKMVLKCSGDVLRKLSGHVADFMPQRGRNGQKRQAFKKLSEFLSGRSGKDL